MTSDESIKPAKEGATEAPGTRRPEHAERRFLARYSGWSASGVLVLALAAPVAGLGWLWSGMRDTTARLAELEERVLDLPAEDDETEIVFTVTRLAERLDAAEASLAAEGDVRTGLETGLAELVRRVDRIDELLNDAPPPVASHRNAQSPDVAGRERARLIEALRRDVANLREMLDTLAARSDDDGAAFVVVLGQLRDAVDSGRPFAAEHETVVALEGSDPDVEADLDILARHAGTGIPPQHTLEASLGHAIADARNAASVAAASGWLDETLAHIGSLVTVRRIDGETAGTGSQATIRRIEAAVAAGDLEEALREIDSLPARSAGIMAQWAGEARARIEADAALGRLHARAVAGIVQP